MAKGVNFTEGRIARFKCEPGKRQTIFWDTKTPGHGVRAYDGGTNSFIFETRLNGDTIRITIGDVKTWTLKKSRAEATRLKGLTDQRIDPRQLQREQAAQAEATRVQADTEARKGALIVNDAWKVYLAHHQRQWGPRHMADHVNLSQSGGQPKKRGKGVTVSGVLHPLLQMRMVDVSDDALTRWQIQESQLRANNARQAFEMFRAFWRWCATRNEYRNVIDAGAVESKDLRAEVPSRKSKRFDTLERAHLPSWFTAVRCLSNPVISAYLQALLLTGARREEMAELRWRDVDFQWNSMWIKDKVAEEGRKIPLTPYLASLLANLKRINETPPRVTKIKREDDTEAPWQPSDWVFFSKAATSGRIAEPRMAHNRALSIAGLNHVTLHGLRRTFANLAEWVEMPRGVIAQIMGHAPNATAEKHYINRPLELLAVWHGKYEAWILEQAGISFAQQAGSAGLRAIA